MKQNSPDFNPGESHVSRRTFLAAAGLAVAGIAIAGCGDNKDAYRPDQIGSVADVIPPALDPADLTTTPIFGIDTSRWQKSDENPESALFDVAQLKAEGVSFQISKATQGTELVDPTFMSYRERADDGGLLFGPYHFLDPGNGAEQAERHVAFVDSTGGTKNLLYALDVEENSITGSKPNLEDVHEYVAKFYELIKNARLIIYTGAWYWGSNTDPGHLNNPDAPENTELWVSQYYKGNPQGRIPELGPDAARPLTPNDPWVKTEKVGTWEYPAIRQFGSNGILQHAQGQLSETEKPYPVVVDMNVSYYPLGTLAGLRSK